MAQRGTRVKRGGKEESGEMRPNLRAGLKSEQKKKGIGEGGEELQRKKTESSIRKSK